ncbi:MAG: hypothetical protein QM758_00925 [Armatimonas sp.]
MTDLLPPPWVRYPNSDPFEIRWRMGEGESYLMDYWEAMEPLEENQKLAYFRNYLPIPGEWLPWVASAFRDFSDQEEYGALSPEESEAALRSPNSFAGIRWLAENQLCHFDTFAEFLRTEMLRLQEEEA